MTVFLDSSALVKRYADESDSDLVRSLRDTVIAGELAQVEVPAALWRKHRLGDISAQDARLLCTRFAADTDTTVSAHSILLITANTDILKSAADLVARHPLRGYDAVQMASAVAASHSVGDCAFGCFDRQLAAAAAAEGLPLLW